MANLQMYFEQFHNTIRVDFDMSAPLREKRDIVLKKIRKHLVDNKLPGIDELLQGSYAMSTGVVPMKGEEYDIDVGLRFNCKETDHKASTVHGWVYSAVKDHTDKVQQKGPCVRVVFKDGYHVDLVSYAYWIDLLGKEQFRLAHRTGGWRPADPPKLRSLVEVTLSAYEGTVDSLTKTNQFRRVVRYLRRWVDLNFNKSVRPSGLAITLLAMKYLLPNTLSDGSSDDLSALCAMASSLALLGGRVTVQKPTPEFEDLMSHLDDDQMTKFKERVGQLATSLQLAKDEVDPVKACEALSTNEFGSDFPVPSPEDTGVKTNAPAVITTSSSA